jgi:hypothetical protein
MSEGKRRLFYPNWLTWPVDRQDREFRVRLVEPRTICPEDHAKIFLAALQPQEPEYLDDHHQIGRSPPADSRFDLLTFPELFLPSNSLVEILSQIADARTPIGCVHTGLRPSGTDASATHLFPARDIIDLTRDLAKIPNLVKTDLAPFQAWLAKQNLDHRFNIGCLFTVDAKLRLRVCLHAKMVSSRDETRPEHELDMKEANLLSLVTLTPKNKDFLPITIQPLLCSDVLNLSTNSPRNHPIDAITSERSCFRKPHADHVDVVSVATCTRSTPALPGAGQLAWHHEFRDSFKRSAAEDQFRRHQFAMFALSNYRDIPRPTLGTQTDPGGLSGIFFPMPLLSAFVMEGVSKPMSILCHHRPGSMQETSNGENVRWEGHDKTLDDHSRNSVLGYIVALDPAVSRDGTATMLALTVTRLPRDANRWERRATVRNLQFYNLTAVSHENRTAQFLFKLLNSKGDS